MRSLLPVLDKDVGTSSAVCAAPSGALAAAFSSFPLPLPPPLTPTSHTATTPPRLIDALLHLPLMHDVIRIVHVSTRCACNSSCSPVQTLAGRLRISAPHHPTAPRRASCTVHFQQVPPVRTAGRRVVAIRPRQACVAHAQWQGTWPSTIL